MGLKHNHNDDNEGRKRKHRRKFLAFYAVMSGDSEGKSCRSNRITKRTTRKKLKPTAGAASSCREFNQILKISFAFYSSANRKLFSRSLMLFFSPLESCRKSYERYTRSQLRVARESYKLKSK